MAEKACSRCRHMRDIELFGENNEFKTCQKCREKNRQARERKAARVPSTYRTEAWKSKVAQGRQEGFRKQFETLDPQYLPEFGRCSRCPRVGRKALRPAADFGVQTKTTKSGITRRYFRYECRQCERERQRQYRQDPEGRKKIRERQRRYRAEHQEEVREYHRIWKEAQRRKQGAKIISPRWKSAPANNDPKLPVEPFADWIRSRAAYYAHDLTKGRPINRTNGSVEGLSVLARHCNLPERRLFGVLKGEYRNGVPLSTVDRALVNEGSTQMWELYDYDEESVGTSS